MKRTMANSRIEIWSHDYINHQNERAKEDKAAVILQIEPAGKENCIVEVVDLASFKTLLGKYPLPDIHNCSGLLE